NASSISLNTKDTFAFNAPDGTKEISEDDLTAGHWLSDWDQAMSLAKATHKIVMVDFMASWCGPCKALDKQSFHTEAFKQETKNIILVKIDIDQQPALAQKYGVEAIPNVQFIDEKGVVVHKFLGLIPDSEVIQNIRTAKSKRP
ncbi:MAG: thioredoxin family protein, partial [Armatimonadetes bacterium]|nr:thioredoxin family protein [Armatimonadota bacterium]